MLLDILRRIVIATKSNVLYFAMFIQRVVFSLKLLCWKMQLLFLIKLGQNKKCWSKIFFGGLLSYQHILKLVLVGFNQKNVLFVLSYLSFYKFLRKCTLDQNMLHDKLLLFNKEVIHLDCSKVLAILY